MESFPPLVDEAIVLTGPTASGKSEVAIALAERIDGEILSLDSIAVYRDMDIGTAKPAAADRERIAHHLIDLVDPTEDFSVACYLRAAHAKVQEIRQRKRAAIFVGGTPMFLKGILRGFDPGPPADWEFRNAVEADIQAHGIEALRRRLRQVDPLAAHRIDPNDTRRMIRALEVARLTGIPISHRQVQFDRGKDASECNVFALAWPRDQLHQRINHRVEQMFQGGLIDEIRQLLTRYGQLSRTACQAVGYREVLEGLRSGATVTTVKEEVAAHTRQLARRQETWFRSFSEIRPVAVREPLDAEATAAQIEPLLQLDRS
ncbi:MAG: tRNA (adenosine(37)-N6)-dimethylallyltransferase MiaA [Planctomycetes bacterium]|nr:tRNA (adenosine(37)-N6)-dimethylallyltransferase MiaA [Planctomycetota bacterium]